MTMKLMSWNVNDSKIKGIKKNKSKLDKQIEAIANVKADIVTLQEVSNEVATYFKEKLSEIGLVCVETSCDLDVGLDIQTGPHKNGTVTDGVLIASRWPLELIPEFFEKIPWQKSALSTSVITPYGEVEAHTVHVPNASSSGQWKEEKGNWTYEKKGTSTTKRGRQIKVCTFKGIYDALSTKSKKHRVLCGDFNSPKEEHRDGTIILFGDKDEHRESEERVIRGLGNYDLKDTYRELNGYETEEYSWKKRRFDHIFSSSSLNPQKCGYLHFIRKGSNNKCLYRYEKGDLSDHSPVYAVYEPEAS